MKFRNFLSVRLYYIPSKYYINFICLICFGSEIGCKKAPNDSEPDITTISYSEDQTNFSNPERGFFYQQAKKDIFNTTEPISESEAFNLSNRSRTGHHNDCLVADVDDWGTYWPIDPASLEAQKNYLSQENKFLPQEGETCNCNPPGSDCTNSMKELEKMRWSALNRDYEPCVLNSWIRDGCYDEIAKRLGYRFRLIESKVPKSARADSLMSFSFIIENDGFAAPYNPRGLELVLRSKSSASIVRFSLSYDPRTWLPDNGKISVNPTVSLPSSMAPGVYEVLLNLPDPEPELNSDPFYSIRFANKDIWEPATGYNSLLTAITITK
jgi:hypothetical protein